MIQRAIGSSDALIVAGNMENPRQILKYHGGEGLMGKQYWDNGPVQLYQADARNIPLPDQSVHCVVTSPPYFGLRVYKDNDDRGIGLESSVEAYIASMVDVFREVLRVLRDDGVAWVNLGDSYGDGGDRLGIPERVVLALQADGWVWRDTIIWAKKSAMPESLAGWRWERCRVKVSEQAIIKQGRYQDELAQGGNKRAGVNPDWLAEWSDCPGCPKCEDNDGLVLRKGSWRCTSAHEYIYMLTKGMGYYADGEAVKLKSLSNGYGGISNKQTLASAKELGPTGNLTSMIDANPPDGYSNRRSVWNDISPEPYGGSHFATFPSDLPRICIQASTSERGVCSECGSQWARVVQRQPVIPFGSASRDEEPVPEEYGEGPLDSLFNESTLGWRPSCGHNAPAIPALVLDPFAGTGTTCAAAQRLGCRAVGVDISEPYLEQAVRRLSAVTLPMGI